ncbi:p-hydroxybenzoic acid efflux pump subunit AaeB [Serratia proteamaculans]|uniref:FUSC family protein n=1 Tax=Serratia proteamaculans TaxID=28151 RepID=UPI002177506C|nr:FUSC family protein [Serratia proteamaculans]CAI0859905.1 p-hydroxybenzoic acid efflux pump subunit AaeB [Serratia proteamaculans]CAI1513427.1 p-hydroxybenzoic acid efflux pump subunit AaeB [Serratia proteamaculans]CAI1609133.1 p-hydroxybenzoic acid efflux pump subunit AaeB [Serratia proteamaculans]CAI1646557.1 p-hydroxybenzoic acid efflux pump subunit AaeB [Serratia proteamaculans]CAI1648727.1 p-hydroxybenzoic acid efflux pump subunit AaeB [Serratia proteamaculans]
MNLPFLEWNRTPWGKATGGQWRYALRNSLAMCLSLWVAFVLNLDEPYWALTSAAVVSFPTVGGVISKSIGRVFGSLVGAAASVAIAGHCLNDPWLFTLFIAAWIGLCTYISNHYQNNVSYAFALAGYTAAIIAFSTVNVTDTQQIFDIAQARVCEVITGILCGGLMMMILPSTSDGEALLTSLRRMHLRLLEHAAMLWQPEITVQMRTSHEGVIGQILTMNLLRIQAFWSHYRLRRQNNLLNYMLHQQLRITSVISSLRRMLLNWPDRPANLASVLDQLLNELRNPDTDKYRLARILQQIAPQDPADYRHRAFWLRLRHFCWLYLNCSRWLLRLESATPVSDIQPPHVTSLARHTDSYEAAYNGLRTFLCIVLGCAYWINTQWEAGSSALTLVAISCVLYSSTPSPINSITTLLKAVTLLSIVCFMVKFGLMIQIDDLWLFCAFLFPVLVTMQMLKLQNPPYAALWGQLIVFMGSFLSVTNPPSYDYQSFINDSLGKIVGVLLAGLAFQILRPSSDKRKSRRIIRALRRDFIDQLSKKPQQSESRFESLIYHRISQLNQSQDQEARSWLLRWGVVLLNCSHIVWQLRDWQTRSDPLSAVRDVCIHCLRGIMTEKGVQHRSLDASLQELQRMSNALAHHPEQAARDLAGLIWRLYCSLQQLQQAITPPDSTAAVPAPR